ncbi:MAG: hypothetical protein LBK66_02385 [Spirochaetaceae bacterium]|jgi:hypothetical protein|nr:hypothetical protein [Spirochaetaceae bacterium]
MKIETGPKPWFWNMLCNRLLIAAALLLASLVGCSITPQLENSPYFNPPAESSRIIEILDYQGYSGGVELAGWVSVYINGGIPALEKLDEFAQYYVFVAEQYSSNLDTLRQWADNFSVEHDFPQLVFLRVYRRLTSNISSNPDELYGSFFETMVKRTASRRWPAAQKNGEIWALVRRVPSGPPSGASDEESATQPDGASAAQPGSEPANWYDDSKLYSYLILCVIDKAEIENSLKMLMNDIVIDKTFTRAQSSAINSIKSNFFNDF